MFKSATLRLTVFYIIILGVICLFFSVQWYRVATNELSRGLGRQGAAIELIPMLNVDNDGMRGLHSLRIQQIEEGKRNILIELLITNAIIIGLGGIGSYLLAKRTIKPIEEAHGVQSRFTADASHELRTPLAAMQSEIEVALRDPKLNKQEAVAILNSNLEELTKLTNLSESLLKLSVHDGEPSLDLGPVDLKDVVDGAMVRVAKRAKDSQIKVENKIKPSIVLADSQNLEDLLVILLDNAIKYSNSGSVVSIISKNYKSSIKISVIDHGQGIKSSDLPYIFERFYRADHSRSKQHSNGYGLGLSIAQKIAQMLGTTIEVKSQVGLGSTFSITLDTA